MRRLCRSFATSSLTHVDEITNRPKMVDVSAKIVTCRAAHARCEMHLPQNILDLFQSVNADEVKTKKGPVFSTATIAGVMAAKNTSNLIPFCHPLPLEKVDIQMRLEGGKLIIDCKVACTHKTGVEMEALTGCSVAALCVYDMCKAVSHDIIIDKTYLVSKTGGKADFHKE